MDTNEPIKEKVATSIRLDAEIYNAIATLATEDDRPSQANMIERLIKTHPRVQPLLETETAGATA